MSHTVFLIEKDKRLRVFWEQALEEEGFAVQAFEDRQVAAENARKSPPDVVFLGNDVGSDPTAVPLLKEIQAINEDVVVISPTNSQGVKETLEAVGSRQRGIRVDQVKIAIRDALELQDAKRRQAYLLDKERSLYCFKNVVAKSAAMREVLRLAAQVLSSDVTVLLLGETGTGKEVFAKAIHFNGPRAAQPYLAVNCAALSEGLLESELFGHEAGAFTDARKMKKGFFEVAHGGTLFLDEVGDMPGALQAKLLRVLESKAFSRVGGTQDIRVDTRVLAATNRDLEELVAKGKFREDLYFRLGTFPIRIPPLRERTEDILPLAKYFITQLNAELNRDIKGLSFSAETKLSQYEWPGNVRELRNALERAVLLCQGDLIEPQDLLLARVPEIGQRDPALSEDLGLEEKEKKIIQKALARARGNKTQAAKLLKISRFALLSRLRKFKIS